LEACSSPSARLPWRPAVKSVLKTWVCFPVWTTSDGVGLALVTPSNEPKNDAGRLAWVRLDMEGRPVGPAVAIGTRATVAGDVDVVPTPGGWLLAWTDRTGEDATVMLATVDAAGKVRVTRRGILHPEQFGRKAAEIVNCPR